MKIAVVSDIHSNLEALRAVEADICFEAVDLVYCLGDIVGYGPFPAECLALIKKLCQGIIKGNHEDCLYRKEKDEDMSRYALEAIRFTRTKMNEAEVAFLAQLPERIILEESGITLCHGAFSEPSMWKYVDSESVAQEELTITPTHICLIGHTHNPFVFDDNKGLYEFLPDDLVLDQGQKYLINVGSIGQPRDGDCRASYGILDIGNSQTVFNLRRVFYNIAAMERDIKQSGLSSFLSERLFRGE